MLRWRLSDEPIPADADGDDADPEFRKRTRCKARHWRTLRSPLGPSLRLGAPRTDFPGLHEQPHFRGGPRGDPLLGAAPHGRLPGHHRGRH